MTSEAKVDPDLSIIIVSYNTREMTLEAIASARRETQTSHEIIVVDNASTDGSAKAIAEAFPDVTLFSETTNHGFAPAHDVARPAVRGKWMLLLNPDTITKDRAIDNLMAFAGRRPKAGIWGGRTLFADGSLNHTSCWRRMSLWTLTCRFTGLSGVFRNSALFNPEAYAGWARDTERQVDIVTGCFLLIETDTWDKLGGFDPAFVMYGEEADLCLRAGAMGYRPRITPDATIVHYGAASEPVEADRTIRVLRAKMELIRRHFSPATRWLGVILFRLIPLTRRFAAGARARLTGRQKFAAQAQVWRDVWSRRAEWVGGFSRSS